MGEQKTNTAAAAPGFVLTPLAELLATADLVDQYVVEGLLVAGTVSCIAAKPRAGKSVFARNLCLAVARGQDFLGRKTRPGECIYLALEERGQEVKNDFRAMGADGSEPLYIHIAPAPAAGMAALCGLVRNRKPRLVVVDPLIRLGAIFDEKAYAEVYSALGPLIDVARESGTHLTLVHHSAKAPRADVVDAPVGSIALSGVAGTVIHMRANDTYRTVRSSQRVGVGLPETILAFDPQTRRISLGETKAESDLQDAANAILDCLQDMPSRKETEILEVVEGRTLVKVKALRWLLQQERITRQGTGRRSQPFEYSLAPQPESAAANNPRIAAPAAEIRPEAPKKPATAPAAPAAGCQCKDCRARAQLLRPS
ncbi:MAG: AAA family ATPase [Acidobacteria bacterium]|nr:AAA family ATPase [Acidobacteriota bacterium]